MTDKKTVHTALHRVQKTLKAPKNQYNKFGNYNYRSCEDILEGLKAILDEGETVTITDEIVMVGNRFYVKAVASFCYADGCVSSTGYAREPESRKGMDESQVTGSTSSYARKYALNALFLIDDTKDADATNDHDKKEPVKKEQKPEKKMTPEETEVYNKHRATLTRIHDAVKAADKESTIIAIRKLQADGIETLPADMKKWLYDEMDKKQAELSPINAG